MSEERGPSGGPDPVTNQLLGDILNRLDEQQNHIAVLKQGIDLLMEGFKEFMPTAADQLVFLLSAVKELQEVIPHDTAERLERLEG